MDGKDLEGSDCALSNVLFWNFHGGREKSNKKVQTNEHSGCNSNWATA
jgi:hypothetical protein